MSIDKVGPVNGPPRTKASSASSDRGARSAERSFADYLSDESGDKAEFSDIGLHLSASPTDSEEQSTGNLSESRVQEIRARIQDGQYQTAEVLRAISSAILRDPTWQFPRKS